MQLAHTSMANSIATLPDCTEVTAVASIIHVYALPGAHLSAGA